ncbi:hypothetical protein ACU5B6_18755 [Moritella viscosa]|uniref:hypothetical protein n=1 Tax=Moritella viscosa TaxID=80854 RepID=UPI00091AF3EB|nr:hypothetical protein [Moritella viscosa]SHO07943.1 unnamed protein product [Moritella viscosa]SHO08013.1 unnamed protein product [Moritella viscosa]SHO16190.1 unnamed protein product [Moritella viscosa]
MKLIDDPKLEMNQVKWFDKHTATMDIKYFNVSGLNDKDIKVKAVLCGFTTITERHLDGLRALLNDKGLKALSNALASAKKRLNSENQSLQITLDYWTIKKLKLKAKQKNMSMSELVKTLLD